ncbi:mucin-2 isoform X2 [Trichomycterus rosablanca]
MERRDIKHSEQVMEFLNITHTLLPHIVTPIKHMKIVFGLKTLIIMWMLTDDKSSASINDKIMKFFPDTLPQYHNSSRRHMELMQRTQQDFKNFAQSLAINPEIRKAYVKDGMEEQYGECYAKKLEERLLHYLEELDKALPQPTYIDQVLNKSQLLGGREELLHQILTCDSAPPSTALKRLLRCALATNSVCDNPGSVCIDLKKSSKEADEHQSFRLDKDKKSFLQEGSLKIRLKRQLDNTDNTGVVLEVCPQMAKNAPVSEKKGVRNESTEHLCSRHGKKMRSILLECSEELRDLDFKVPSMQAECTPTSPHTPLLQSTSHKGTQTSKLSPQDSSCSTNISLSLDPDSSDLDEVSQIISAQSTSSHQVNSLRTSLVYSNSSASLSQEHHVALTPTFSAQTSLSKTPSLRPITSSPVSAVKPVPFSADPMQAFDPTRQALDEGVLFVSPLKSIPEVSLISFQTITPSPEPLPVRPALSQQSSSSFNLSPFPLNQTLQASTSSDEQIPSSTTFTLRPTSPLKSVFHQTCLLSPSPPTTSASSAPVANSPGQNQHQKTVRQFLDADATLSSRTPSPLPVDPINNSLLSSSKPASQMSSSDENSSFPEITQASASLVEQESFSPLFHQICTCHQLLSSATSSTSSTYFFPSRATLTPTQNATHISDPAKQGEELGVISCNPRLSLETQSFLLLCKWMQPHVKLCRLSQRRVSQATMTMKPTEQSFEDEVYSFDVNRLYSQSDSESDPQDSDDPDYNPPNKWKL